MVRTVAVLAAAAVAVHLSPGAGQEKARPAESIFVGTPNGWLLTVHTDGSGRLVFGAGGPDEWTFKAGTVDVARAEKELRDLPTDPKGSIGTHFAASFGLDRKGPDARDRVRYTRDRTVIPGLLKAAADATAARNEFDARRRAELLKSRPPGALPAAR